MLGEGTAQGASSFLTLLLYSNEPLHWPKGDMKGQRQHSHFIREGNQGSRGLCDIDSHIACVDREGKDEASSPGIIRYLSSA